jgi:hypothetical protein
MTLVQALLAEERLAKRQSQIACRFVDLGDLPECRLEREMTVDIDAKAKELVVLRLMEKLPQTQGREPVKPPDQTSYSPKNALMWG